MNVRRHRLSSELAALLGARVTMERDVRVFGFPDEWDEDGIRNCLRAVLYELEIVEFEIKPRRSAAFVRLTAADRTHLLGACSPAFTYTYEDEEVEIRMEDGEVVGGDRTTIELTDELAAQLRALSTRALAAA